MNNTMYADCEDNWGEGIPPKLMKVWNKNVIISMYTNDGLSRESVITICKFNELNKEVGSWED